MLQYMMKLLVTLQVLVQGLEYGCMFPAPDGIVYDLTGMAKTAPPDYAIKGADLFEYRANVCNPVFQPCRGDYTGIAVQWYLWGPCQSILGRENPLFGGLNPPVLSYLYEGNPSAGVSLLFQNGDFCYGFTEYERQVRYDIKCDRTTSGELVSAQEIEKCVYVLEFLSSSGCPPNSVLNAPPPPKPLLGRLYLLLLCAGTCAGLYGLLYWCSGESTRAILSPSYLLSKEGWNRFRDLCRNSLAFLIVKMRYSGLKLFEEPDHTSL